MKLFFAALLAGFILITNSYAQDGSFNNLSAESFTKGAGVNDYYGWGKTVNNLIDPRPNSSSGGAFIINAHQGLTFSAHSVYGGIRFYNQSYPGGPLDPNNGATMVMSITGNNVGVGTTTPYGKLHVYQNTVDQPGLVIQGNCINVDANQHYIAMTLDGDYGNASGNYSQIRSYSNLYGGWGSQLAFFTTQSGVANTINERMRIDANGNVGIGTTNAQGYKLAVNGNVIAEEIKVKLHTNWPDYVFKPVYKLPPLSEVKQYIDKNQHLPEIPTAAEMTQNGIDLGDMNTKLLKKVEELTLYMIEKDKEITELKQQEAINKLQQKQIDELQKQVKAMLKTKQ
ncbi:hypothetical protein HQ865_15315 [Mucilaginibacter mali]|uniref:Uncharacterized protein n=1 Tax=Mucilaginibacter mali TaxID=2740462 RepID=A0A7D4QAT5_9SPHI|nr:hypothetical protein [Mucilaginibacter mali]QKJ31065.1 hypothetical protein HQ865_15315 [Mucilaginibacter mali]